MLINFMHSLTLVRKKQLNYKAPSQDMW